MKTFSNIPKKLLSITSFVLAFGLSIQTVFAGYPTQVPNVQATVENDTVKLTWEDSTSDDDIVSKYKIYYGKKSVKVEGQDYTELPITLSATKKSHTFDKLEKNTPYFFAITALDSMDRESQNYSLEVTATIGKATATEETTQNNPETNTLVPEKSDTETSQENNDPQNIAETLTQTEENNQTQETPVNNTDTPVINTNPEETQTTETATEPMQPSAPVDTDAPAPAKNIHVSKSNNSATISWKKSVSPDLAFQRLVYKAENENWKFKDLSNRLSSTKIKTSKDTKYQVKVISIDNAGNKSESEIKEFSTTSLTKSGPASKLAIIIALSFLGLLLFTSKRRA